MINKIVICDTCGERVIFNCGVTDKQIHSRLSSHNWFIGKTENICPKCKRVMLEKQKR